MKNYDKTQIASLNHINLKLTLNDIGNYGHGQDVHIVNLDNITLII